MCSRREHSVDTFRHGCDILSNILDPDTRVDMCVHAFLVTCRATMMQDVSGKRLTCDRVVEGLQLPECQHPEEFFPVLSPPGCVVGQCFGTACTKGAVQQILSSRVPATQVHDTSPKKLDTCVRFDA